MKRLIVVTLVLLFTVLAFPQGKEFTERLYQDRQRFFERLEADRRTRDVTGEIRKLRKDTIRPPTVIYVRLDYLERQNRIHERRIQNLERAIRTLQKK